MFDKFRIQKILKQASDIDVDRLLFGANKHNYELNPVIKSEIIKKAEEKYSFSLPKDYYNFLTEVGNGGACVDYGLYPFEKFLAKGADVYSSKLMEQSRCSMAKPLCLRPMLDKDVEDYGFTRDAYEAQPNSYFVFDEHNNIGDDEIDNLGNGFFVLGTHGCQWDYGVVVTGDRRGQIFDIDSEGAYFYLANSFEEFYNQWLDKISNIQWLANKIMIAKKRLKL